MKDRVIAVHIALSEYNSATPMERTGTITFFRYDDQDEHNCRLSSNRPVPGRRVSRALEAQRLFLAQLERNYQKYKED